MPPHGLQQITNHEFDDRFRKRAAVCHEGHLIITELTFLGNGRGHIVRTVGDNDGQAVGAMPSSN